MNARGDKSKAPEKISELPFDRLGAAVERERERHFVGREAELELFESMLASSPPFRGLLIHGPGGVGKSTLLDAMHRRAHELGLTAIHLDGQDLPGDRRSLEQVFVRTIESATVRPGGLAVLFVDAFESLASMENWFRDTLLAGLPGRFRVVLAMRRHPSAQWHLDPGWSRLVRIHELEGLGEEAADRLLEQVGVPAGARSEVQALTHGHPLALTLAGQLYSAHPGREVDLRGSPELVRELSERNLADAPSPLARDALFACALVRRLTPPLLAAMLAEDEVGSLFDWVRRQAFVRESMHGLIAHDLVGEALCNRLEHRHPDRHRRFIRRGMRHLLEQVGVMGEAVISDVLFLMRGLPAIRQSFVIERDTGLHTDRLREGDAEPLAALLEQEWGRKSRRWFETWVAAAPEWLAVLRDREQQPVGMSFYLDMTAIDEDLAQADPAVRAFRDHVERNAPLRDGERAMLARFLFARNETGPLPAGVAQLQCHNAFMPISMDNLALTGTVRPDTEANRVQALYSGIHPLNDTEFVLDDQAFFIMGHDWRVESFAEWIDGVMERLTTQGEPADPDCGAEVMPREDFDRAVRQVLDAMRNQQSLEETDLARSLMVRRADGGHSRGGPGEVLGELVQQAIDELADHRRGQDLIAVLHHTYLEPAPKQRAAAHEAGLTYGTYRRRLREAISELSERLWRRERAASNPDDV